jgi:CBS domain-containing protein
MCNILISAVLHRDGEIGVQEQIGMSKPPLGRLRTLHVSDVMNRNVIKLNAQQRMSEIAKEFSAHNISAAPVVDESGRCIGILSATDFLQRKSADTADAIDVASSYMTRTVRTVQPNMLLLNAAILMNAEHIHRLPVVDENQRIVGMISTMDVVAAVINSIDEMESMKFQGGT